MSKWLFMRNYLLLFCFILSVGWGMDRLIMYDSEQENLVSDTQLLRGSLLYIESIFTDNPDSITQIWSDNHVNLEEQLGYPLAMYPLSDFSGGADLLESLALEPIVGLSSGDGEFIYYSQLGDSEYIFALGPLSNRDKGIPLDVLLIFTYYLLIASVLLLWFAPLSRDLQKLRQVASEFGAEDFAARVKLGKNSSITLLADSFNAMAQRIQVLVSAHKELTHAVSHELKTPLARFKFSLEIIEGIDNKQHRGEYLQAMKQDVRELDELIEEMLSYARFDVQNLSLNLQEMDAKLWLDDLLSQYQPEPIQISRHFSTNSTHQVSLLIDRHLMDRAVHNLIRNGLRYAESQLQLSLFMDEHDVRLHIDDDGDGIPENFREQVFQPFMRLETSRDKQSGGYGLGLAIVKKIVQQHGGEITVDKSVLGGARFCLCWPLRG